MAGSSFSSVATMTLPTCLKGMPSRWQKSSIICLPVRQLTALSELGL